MAFAWAGLSSNVCDFGFLLLGCFMVVRQVGVLGTITGSNIDNPKLGHLALSKPHHLLDCSILAVIQTLRKQNLAPQMARKV